MSRRFDSARLLYLIAFLLLILLGFYFGVLRVREAGGSVVRTMCAYWPNFNCDNHPAREALHINLTMANSSHRKSLGSSLEIRQMLARRLGDPRNEIGIVVGVIEPDGRRIVIHGPQAFDGDTVFEIGSITKVFTALLLPDMVLRGEVAFSDPVAKWLPAHVRVPAANGREITLMDLASHTSGLPRMPSNFRPADPSNPYVDYTAEQLYQFLATNELPRDIGSQVEYSNVGYGLLGHALERRTGMDYESLVRTRVLDPLGMRLTGVSLSPEMRARLAPGHNGKLERVGNWDLTVLGGAGALRSTANDMLTFFEGTLGTIESLLEAAITTMLQLPDAKGRKTPIGWMVVTLDGAFSPDAHHIVWMGGGTAGYRTFLGFDAKARAGVVVLANVCNISVNLSRFYDVDQIGLQLLDERFVNYQ